MDGSHKHNIKQEKQNCDSIDTKKQRHNPSMVTRRQESGCLYGSDQKGHDSISGNTAPGSEWRLHGWVCTCAPVTYALFYS